MDMNMEFFNFKCKYCGGEPLTKVEGVRFVGKCKYCGRIQTVPHPPVGDITELFNTAERFRVNCEFEKADALYEQILKVVKDDPEIYWLRVLCRYGIEYVKDPQTNERKPTVHRMRHDLVFADANYDRTMQYANDAQKKVYERDAREINETVRRCLELLPKVHFKVFICYKETDQQGKRTDDSIYAERLYNLLTKKGIETFYSRITLQNKPGTVYEPYIFAALNSANVMVVISSKPEYIDSVWVKNEWSRYLSLIQESGSQRVLMPAVIRMNPYELPQELLHLQAKEVSNARVLDDLAYDIEKIINGIDSVGVILKDGYAALSLGNWQNAEERFKQVLVREPQNAEAYLGLLMKEYHIGEKAQLADCKEAFEKSKYFRGVEEYGSSELKHELNAYLLKRAYNFLISSDWKNAKGGFKGVLDRQPDSMEAHLGLLLAECTLYNEAQLANCKAAFYMNPHFQWLQVNGSAELKQRLVGYMLQYAYTLLRESKWREAKECLTNMRSRNVQSIGVYLALLLEECRACEKAQLVNCKKAFDSSPYYQWLQVNGTYELKYELNAYLETIKARRKKTQRKRLCIAIVSVVCLILIGVGLYEFVDWSGDDREYTDTKPPKNDDDREYRETDSPKDDEFDEDEETDGVVAPSLYTYEIIEGMANITASDASISGDITIPSSLGGYPVAYIGAEAFANRNITGVTIPDGVVFIDNRAFTNCRQLTSVSIPDSIQYMGIDVFYGSDANLIKNTYSNGFYLGNASNPYVLFYMCAPDATFCEIASGTRIIDAGAFANCTELTSLVFPDGVIGIGYNAFLNCSALKELYIPASMTYIEDAFEACWNLISIEYGGTRYQWEALVGASEWYAPSSGYIIYCTDGYIYKDVYIN